MANDLIQRLIEEGWVVDIKTNLDNDKYPYSAEAIHTSGKMVIAEGNSLNQALTLLSSLAHSKVPFSEWENKEREARFKLNIYVPIGSDRSYDKNHYLNDAREELINLLDSAGFGRGDMIDESIVENQNE